MKSESDGVCWVMTDDFSTIPVETAAMLLNSPFKCKASIPFELDDGKDDDVPTPILTRSSARSLNKVGFVCLCGLPLLVSVAKSFWSPLHTIKAGEASKDTLEPDCYC